MYMKTLDGLLTIHLWWRWPCCIMSFCGKAWLDPPWLLRRPNCSSVNVRLFVELSMNLVRGSQGPEALFCYHKNSCLSQSQKALRIVLFFDGSKAELGEATCAIFQRGFSRSTRGGLLQCFICKGLWAYYLKRQAWVMLPWNEFSTTYCILVNRNVKQHTGCLLSVSTFYFFL